MKSIRSTLESFKCFNRGEVIGVAVSGGIDSMCMLHFLHKIKDLLSVEIVAIHINHMLREEADDDAKLVAKFCKENDIKLITKKINVKELAAEKKMTIEEAARTARYTEMDKLIAAKKVHKICIAHHTGDQAETILMNIFRGCGLTGAAGMKVVRGKYIRPMLRTVKEEIIEYQELQNVPFTIDTTNNDSAFSRNFLRNEVMPLIKKKWANADQNIINFGKIANSDDAYINNSINYENIIETGNLTKVPSSFMSQDSKNNKVVKIPLSFFFSHDAVSNRMVKQALRILGSTKDIENKHFKLLKNMAKEANNGVKIALPNGILAHKEYDMVALSLRKERTVIKPIPLASGTIDIPNFGKITVKKSKNILPKDDLHMIDVDALPSDAVWRNRESGDMFKKFGGGTKKLNDYFTDKKIPTRIRSSIPVLASKNEILVVADLDIADSVKITENTKSAYTITYKKY